MSKAKFYAVRRGFKTGIFTTWGETEGYVRGFQGAQYKGFKTKEEALAYLGQEGSPEKPIPVALADHGSDAFGYVDGSFNSSTKTYGYGGFIHVDGHKHVLQGSANDPLRASMHNVAGEIDGAMAVISKAIALNLPTLTIYYDYEGVKEWATGGWKTKSDHTRQYARFMNLMMQYINVDFVHVKGHSGIEGNEIADQLAKQAVGLQG